MSEASDLLRLADAIDINRAGAKASRLARLMATGERIPDGFVIATNATSVLDSPLLRSEIEEALTDLGSQTVAVRSSAVGEDSKDESHAGQYETVLGVSADVDSVLGAADKVVRSGDGTPMAVLVQGMVDAKTAGAAFSANPVTGDREVIVSAVVGLADQLMEGSIAGDEWVVRDGSPIHLSGEAIDGDLVLKVAETAERLEAEFGYPVDIEWAYDGTLLHLLQCRPITALPERPNLEYPDGSWQKDSTHHSAPLSPLVDSYMRHETDEVARWMERAGLILDRLNQVTVGGELYVQPVPVGGPPGGKAPPRFVMGILARLHPKLRGRMATARRLIEGGELADLARKWSEEWKPQMVAAVAGLRAVDLPSLDDEALLAHVEDVLAFASSAGDIHFDLVSPYMLYLHELVLGCERMLGWDENATLRLLAGHSPASSEPTVAMAAVAETIRRSPAAMAAFDQPDGDLVERLSAADADSAAAIARWINTYGFRTTQYDWSSLTIAEQPGLIGRMIRTEIDAKTHLLDGDDIEAAARKALSPEDVAEFDDLLAKARAIYPVREDNLHLTVSTSAALLRSVYLQIGSRLANRGIIATAEDVFMLGRDEVIEALAPASDPLFGLVRGRRAERAWVAAHPGPGLLGDPPGLPPDLGALPEAGRRLNQALLWFVGKEFTPINPSEQNGDSISGIPGAAGVHTGTARVVRTEADFDRVRPGDVVICPITNPSWSVLFGIAGAFVCDAGGPLSHTAVLTREYAIPSVLATGNASQRIADGTLVTVDGTAGTVKPA
jgi:rifampicin phosphotransferase